ncbi:MAG TPA: flagellar basal body P-ring formation protein FlgA [Desulfobacterales bacterium]|nr:flagellar basal body P-ring formation protein FlgA [Desulfobacterales bacterium]
MKNPNAIRLTAVIAIAILFGFCDAWADPRAYIAVKKEAWIKGEKVYLKDIAAIEGPVRLREGLAAICLGHAPAPAKQRIFKGSWIESKIRSRKCLPADAAVRVPESVVIGRTWQSIREKRFLSIFNGYIASQLKTREADFRVSRFKVIGNGSLPEGEIKVQPVRQADARLLGHVSLTAIVRVDGKIERRVVLSGWVDRFEDVVCTTRSLTRSRIITEDDLGTTRRNISRLPHNVLASTQDVIGKRLKQTLKADAVLLANMVEKPPLIKRGDRVTIVAESSTLLITALGVAQTKGGIGDQVRVKNCMNKKEVIARIVDASTVKVKF